MDDLPKKSYSLAEFCETAKTLLIDDEDAASFVRFVLCGIYQDHQAVIDAIQNRLDDSHNIQGLRDFDSLLGIHRDIVVSQTSLTLFPIAKKEDTLKTNIHLTYSFVIPNIANTVPVHKIPNICIAKWSVQNTIRALFPALCKDDRLPILTQEEQKIFYEKGFRPAVVELLGPSAADWPPNYESEMFRARGHNGQLSFMSKMLPEWHVRGLGNTIREHLHNNGVSWGEGLVFLHQIRGVKNSSQHTPYEGDSECALEEWLDENSLKLIDLTGDNWWVDVGLQISSSKEECLAWRTDSHFHVVKQVLRIRDHQAERITTITSSKYTRDMASHLTAVSGCRITPGPRAEGPFSVQYLQLYTTDKSLTYRQELGRHGKFITCSEVLAGKAEKYCENLYNVYLAAMEDNYSLARVEVRIPIKYASSVLIDLRNEMIHQWLVSFPKVVWWSLRAYRALAFKFILQWQASGNARYRSADQALLLTAAGPWLLNGLHSTPDDRSASRELMTAILPHVNRVDAEPNTFAFPPRRSNVQEGGEEGEEEGDESTDSENSGIPARAVTATANTIPCNPYGLVFLRYIRVGDKYPVPRFDQSKFLQHMALSDKAWLYIFGKPKDEIKDHLLNLSMVNPVNPRRIPNRVKHTARRPNLDNEGEAMLFDLTSKGYKLPEPVVDEGSDQGTETGNQDFREDNTVDSVISDIWRQFFVDLTATAPNPKNASSPSYCKLNAHERSLVDEQAHKNRRLSDHWVDCQWKIATDSEWTLTFDRLWPKTEHVLYGKAQNYKNSTYYTRWRTLMSDSDDATASAIRGEIRKKFDLLFWLPHAQTDRIWHTKFVKGFKRSNGIEESNPAPRILINPKAGDEPTW